MKSALLKTLLLIPILCFCTPTDEAPEAVTDVIMVLDMAGLGDKGFNDAGWKGVQRAIDELGISATYLQSSEQSDYISNLTLASQRAEIVVAMGFLMVDALGKVAPLHPDTKFIFVDGEVKGENVASFDFKAQEGAFLAGILAAMTTKALKVGCVMGMDIPPVRAYEVGFRAGILAVKASVGKSVKYHVATIGDFNNPARGKSLAQGLIGQGCDIVLQLAGNSGLGVIEAVKEMEGVYVIGADMDQDDLAPGKVLASILKRIDVAVYGAIRDAKSNRFKQGHQWIGIKEGATDLTDSPHLKDLRTVSIEKMLTSARNWIRAGGNVPASAKALNRFSVEQIVSAW
ncbi:MAG: BMP family ABC transporter substrate-binding protein [Candidatus Latescibacterota bacterium]|nr:BMP family ABC transporter substrate-binding protein [Candidatus Latescibacterota bacterium]